MDNNEMLRQANLALQKAVDEKNRKKLEAERAYLVGSIGKDLVREIAPAMQQMQRDNAAFLRQAIQEIRQVKLPEIQTPVVNVPTPQVDVNVDLASLKIPSPNYTLNPIVKIPDLKFPETQKIEGWVQLMGVTKSSPLPVTLRNEDGSVADLFKNLTSIVGGGGGGGKSDYFTIKGYSQSAFAELTNPDGRVKVELPTGSSGLTDAELRASSVPVEQVSGSSWSVNVLSSTGTTGTTLLNGDGTYRDTIPVQGTVAVSGITNSVASSLIDSSGVQYSGSNPLPVTITSGASATSAVNLVDSTGVAYSGSNPLPIVGPVVVTSITNTTATNIVDSTGVAFEGANPFPITIITSATATVNSRIVDSSGVGYDGSNPFPIRQAGGTVNSLAVNLVDSSGVGYSGSNPLPIVGPVVVTSITNTTATNLVDSSGVGYSGSNPVPITIVTSATATVNTALTDSGGVQYSGSNPVPITIVSTSVGTTAAVYTRQTNPTAVASDYVPLAADDLGRQLMRPVQVRDLTTTAYVSVSNGTEATLLAGTAAKYNDLIYILASNNSTAAVGIDIRPSTAGSVVMHLEIPANGTVGVAAPVPIPQQATGDGTGGAWTVDLPDITGTTVYVSGLFSQEI